MKRSILMLGLFIFILVPATMLYAESVKETWVATYNGPENDQDVANQVAVDAQGNVYVTGQSAYRSRTVKYDSSGNLLWVAGVGGSQVKIDASGNVLVSGGGPSSTYASYNVSKLSPDGTVLWSSSGTTTGATGGQYMATDPQGNVYVTITPSQYGGFYTSKYDTNGNLLWNRYFDTLGEVAGIAVDRDGNVFITGYGNGIWTPATYIWDYVTVKYDSNGNQQWAATYNGPYSDQDIPSSIAVDSAGNVYVTGSAVTGYTYYANQNIATLKYDTVGNLIWVRLSAFSGADIGRKVIVDSHDNIYVSGTGSSYTGAFIVYKYAQDGTLLWSANYDGPEWNVADSMALDTSDNVYINGRSDYYSLTAVKFDSNGNFKWVKSKAPSTTYQVAGANDTIAVGADGNVYVVGGASNGGWYGNTLDFITIRYSPDMDDDGFAYYEDCNDNDPLINPAALEIPYNGIDENCNGMADDDDLDHDGYGIATDCNDGDASIYPGAPETKFDGIDQDCNGYDLTISITKANYTTVDDSLRVEATSALNAAAGLQLEGYGPMTWKSNQSKWVITIQPANGDPGSVRVCGVEGCESAAVIPQ